ncbi:hypothetical protein FOA52_012939 [Chlamydomonas sp. UWO 241]|nr:hypothetical protein FOA52_012939 [Chlamydomonas sp. UWO 241]
MLPRRPPRRSVLESITDTRGCVDVTPSLKPGEYRELGVTIPAGLVPRYKQTREEWSLHGPVDQETGKPMMSQKEWQKVKWSEAGQVQLVASGAVTGMCPLPDDAVLKRIDDYTRRGIFEFLGLHENPKRDLPESLPCKGVERGVIPNDDARKPLRGKLGLFATEDLAQAPRRRPHVGGVYGGLMVVDQWTHDELAQGTPPTSWKGSGDEWEQHVEGYCFSEDAFNIPASADGSTEQKQLFIEGVGYGNLTALANDPKMVDAMLAAGRVDRACYEAALCANDVQPNCTLVQALVRGWPTVFLVVFSPVKAGFELLYCYGHAYWQFQWQCSNRVARAQAKAQAEAAARAQARVQRNLQKVASAGKATLAHSARMSSAPTGPPAAVAPAVAESSGLRGTGTLATASATAAAASAEQQRAKDTRSSKRRKVAALPEGEPASRGDAAATQGPSPEDTAAIVAAYAAEMRAPSRSASAAAAAAAAAVAAPSGAAIAVPAPGMAAAAGDEAAAHRGSGSGTVRKLPLRQTEAARKHVGAPSLGAAANSSAPAAAPPGDRLLVWRMTMSIGRAGDVEVDVCRNIERKCNYVTRATAAQLAGWSESTLNTKLVDAVTGKAVVWVVRKNDEIGQLKQAGWVVPAALKVTLIRLSRLLNAVKAAGLHEATAVVKTLCNQAKSYTSTAATGAGNGAPAAADGRPPPQQQPPTTRDGGSAASAAIAGQERKGRKGRPSALTRGAVPKLAAAEDNSAAQALPNAASTRPTARGGAGTSAERIAPASGGGKSGTFAAAAAEATAEQSAKRHKKVVVPGKGGGGVLHPVGSNAAAAAGCGGGGGGGDAGPSALNGGGGGAVGLATRGADAAGAPPQSLAHGGVRAQPRVFTGDCGGGGGGGRRTGGAPAAAQAMPEPQQGGAGSVGAGGSGSMAVGGSCNMAAASPSSGGPRCSVCPRTLTKIEQRLALASSGKCMICIAAGVPGGSACRVCNTGFGPADAALVQCAQCALLMHATCAATAANSPSGVPSGGLQLCLSCQGALSQAERNSERLDSAIVDLDGKLAVLAEKMQQRLHVMDSKFTGIAEAWRWVHDNKARFRGDVLGPIGMEISALPGFTGYVEAQCGYLFNSFVVTSRGDEKVLSDWLREKDHSFGVLLTEDPELPVRHPLGNASQYAHLGVTHTLDEVINAPAVIKQLLCDVHGFNLAYVAHRDSNVEAIFDAMPEPQPGSYYCRSLYMGKTEFCLSSMYKGEIRQLPFGPAQILCTALPSAVAGEMAQLEAEKQALVGKRRAVDEAVAEQERAAPERSAGPAAQHQTPAGCIPIQPSAAGRASLGEADARVAGAPPQPPAHVGTSAQPRVVTGECSGGGGGGNAAAAGGCGKGAERVAAGVTGAERAAPMSGGTPSAAAVGATAAAATAAAPAAARSRGGVGVGEGGGGGGGGGAAAAGGSGKGAEPRSGGGKGGASAATVEGASAAAAAAATAARSKGGIGVAVGGKRAGGDDGGAERRVRARATAQGAAKSVGSGPTAGKGSKGSLRTSGRAASGDCSGSGPAWRGLPGRATSVSS